MSEHAPDADELRLALVLNGGVSLAIWMSGVVAEIDALRRADEAGAAGSGDAGSSVAIYAKLVAALGLRVRVDVIAGTSAGGLNGGMLAAAVATGQPFAGVRDLWMKVGDLHGLLRLGEVDQGLPSLLKGEKVLYGELKKRFQVALDGPVDAAGADDTARRVRLIVTGTDVAGVSHDTKDSFGGTLAIVDHRLRARFAHVGDAEATDVPGGWGEMLPSDRDARLGVAEAMARAARTSASFPFAFEPSELSLWAEGAPGPTPLGAVLVTRDGLNVAAAMRARAAATPTQAPPLTRYAIDGGVLDNSPVGAVLETITSLSSEAPVQRVVVFVVPYADDAEAPAGSPPGAGKVLGTVLNMPRDVAIADHLEEVERDLARRAGDRTSFDELLSLPAGQLADLAAQLYPTFWRLRAATSMWTLVQRYRARLADPPAVDVSLPDARTREALVAAAKAADARWLPPGDARPADLWPSADDGGPAWRFGGAPATRVALRIADWIKGAREALEPGDASRSALRDCQAAVHRALLAYRTGEVARQRAEAAAIAAAPGTLDPAGLARLSSATWTDERCAAGRTLLHAAAEALVAARACTQSREARDRLRVGPDEAAIAADDMARRLLQADVAWRGLRGPLEDEYQASARYEFMRLNATAPVAFGDGRAGRPQDKLFGMQLGHFAAFMCSGWRANDWLWGRLDGAARLVDLLLAPARLQLSPVRRDVLAAALGKEDVQAFLAAAPFRNHASELVEADDDGELRYWRGEFRDALAEAIVAAEVGALTSALRDDVAAGFDGETDLGAALDAKGSPRERFAAYAGLLRGADGGTGIEARVARERRSGAGKRLLADTADVAADLMATIGGPVGMLGKALELPTDLARMGVGLREKWHATLHRMLHGEPDDEKPADAG